MRAKLPAPIVNAALWFWKGIEGKLNYQTGLTLAVWGCIWLLIGMYL